MNDKPFEKMVRLGWVPVDTAARRSFSAFCKIEYKSRQQDKPGMALSITGVIGPTANGHTHGGCGQIDEALRTAKFTSYAPGWGAVKVAKFLQIWDTWHLNDMRPYCEHQKALGWSEKTREKVEVVSYTTFRYTYDLGKTLAVCQDPETAARLGREIADCNRAAAEALGQEIHKKGAHCWTAEQKALMDRYAVIDKAETKQLGWTYPEEHPEGLLCRPCPTCGYKYGSEWRYEEVPAEMLGFLRALPDTDTTPAWV